jgi:hypothetical protein
LAPDWLARFCGKVTVVFSLPEQPGDIFEQFRNNRRLLQ